MSLWAPQPASRLCVSSPPHPLPPPPTPANHGTQTSSRHECGRDDLLLGTLPVTAPGPLPSEETLEGPVLSEEPTLGQTNVSRILGCVTSLAYMVAPGEREKDPHEPGRAPLPTRTVLGRAPLTWLGPKVGPGPPTATPLPHPPAHQATDPSLTSPRRVWLLPSLSPSLTQATGGPEPLSPSTTWGAGSGTHWWSLIPGSPCLGSGQLWGSIWGAGVATGESPALSSAAVSVWSPASSGGPTGLPTHALSPAATAFPWRLLPTPK